MQSKLFISNRPVNRYYAVKYNDELKICPAASAKVACRQLFGLIDSSMLVKCFGLKAPKPYNLNKEEGWLSVDNFSP